MSSPPTLVPFYSLTLGHLIHPKADLIVWCGACRRTGRLEVLPVLAQRGPAFGVRDLEKVLTCGRCDRRGFATVRVEWL